MSRAAQAQRCSAPINAGVDVLPPAVLAEVVLAGASTRSRAAALKGVKADAAPHLQQFRDDLCPRATNEQLDATCSVSAPCPSPCAENRGYRQPAVQMQLWRLAGLLTVLQLYL